MKHVTDIVTDIAVFYEFAKNYIFTKNYILFLIL